MTMKKKIEIEYPWGAYADLQEEASRLLWSLSQRSELEPEHALLFSLREANVKLKQERPLTRYGADVIRVGLRSRNSIPPLMLKRLEEGAQESFDYMKTQIKRNSALEVTYRGDPRACVVEEIHPWGLKVATRLGWRNLNWKHLSELSIIPGSLDLYCLQTIQVQARQDRHGKWSYQLFLMEIPTRGVAEEWKASKPRKFALKEKYSNG